MEVSEGGRIPAAERGGHRCGGEMLDLTGIIEVPGYWVDGSRLEATAAGLSSLFRLSCRLTVFLAHQGFDDVV